MSPSLRNLACALLLGTFVIDTPQCGDHRSDHAQLALGYLDAGRYDRALTEIQRALRQRDDDPTLYLVAAMAHLGQKQVEEAVGMLAQGLALAPGDDRLQQTLRDICQQAERFDLARSTLEELLRKFPGNASLQASLGWAYLQLEEEEKAIELLLQATSPEVADTSRETTDLFAHVQLSRIYLQQQRLEEAIQILRRALEIAPDDQRLLLVLGETQLRQRAPEEASDTFARALEQSEQPQLVAARIAQLYYEEGWRRQTIAYYERALEYDAENPFVLNNLAWTYAEEGIELDRALQLATRAVKRDPDSPVYLDTYAELYYLKERPDRAVVIMRRALELEPEDGEHFAYLQQQMEKFRLQADHMAREDIDSP
ncbi:MAG: tetratricopeptide repeat protein [Gemmatimonadetes bacterium]|jgi:tetratricopeptide (TPR) repeat protein|nr:tetratricopeptide repeat protein [Gemmatimonadota bacterium]